ncbi:MAG: cupredoxin family copper-binding protein [Proteobacteria bacterium]|nr:cupredoxin family copper-binding protein [Pseudomonadota bacterium]
MLPPIASTTQHARLLRRGAALLLAAALATASRATPTPATTVSIDQFAFAPKEITVHPGTTIVWTNHDQTPHMVMARDKSFTSAGLDTDDSYRHTFTQPGDFSYFCSMHPFMTGIVHVRP